MTDNHQFTPFFNPQSIAIIGASEREASVGKKVMSNMLASGFAGGLYPVNPKHQSVFNKPCYATVKDVQAPIDLAVITTPAITVPDIMRECGETGIHSVIIISAGFSEMGEAGKALEQEILAIAHQYHLHFIGPNCLGLMRPHAKLNATFDNNFALPGSVALVSQSGAICAAIVDWAMGKEIGFSAIASIGNSIDLDFGDMLDFFAEDPLTKSILLYIEGVHYPDRFLKGLRKAARVKPVIAIKAGRNASGARAVHSHTGALIGDDDVFSAVLASGGAVRVDSIEALFTAAQVLSSDHSAKGKRLTIITNGGGAGVMAADRAMALGLELPSLSKASLAALNQVLPSQWSHQNPIDILGDATPKRYQQAIDICLDDSDNDALLAILVPIAMVKPHEVAKSIIDFAKQTKKPLLTCWMGEKQVHTSWQLFSEHNIPCYSTPEVAVEAFSYLANYHANQQLLLQTPETFPVVTKPAEVQIKQGELTTMESKEILHAFGIPVSKTELARTEKEAVVFAESMGFPIVMKIASPDISHKQDVGGVYLNIETAQATRTAYQQMMQRVKANRPDAKILGVTIERFYQPINAREVMIGIIRDKVFGPAIVFGLGGSLVEVIRDRAIALPPLNEFLARQLIAKTKAAKILGEFRGKPAINMDALVKVLLRVSDMALALPELAEMDINPLFINEKEAIAVDARIVIK